ncbi:hypothetical protein MUGA111182_06230 [Mucilaginibacter galii]|nr:hypothetical protein [Mucilaginibacter galii]
MAGFRRKGSGPQDMKCLPTESGRFVIAKIERHISYGKYALWSDISWGAGLKFVNDVTHIDANNRGLWQKLTVYRPIWLTTYKNEAAIKKLF